jgi:hypothetical protein
MEWICILLFFILVFFLFLKNVELKAKHIKKMEDLSVQMADLTNQQIKLKYKIFILNSLDEVLRKNIKHIQEEIFVLQKIILKLL